MSGGDFGFVMSVPSRALQTIVSHLSSLHTSLLVNLLASSTYGCLFTVNGEGTQTESYIQLVYLCYSQIEDPGYWHQRADERHGNPPPR